MTGTKGNLIVANLFGSFLDQQSCPVCTVHTRAGALWERGPEASDETSTVVQYGHDAHAARDPGGHQGGDQETGLHPCPNLLSCWLLGRRVTFLAVRHVSHLSSQSILVWQA